MEYMDSGSRNSPPFTTDSKWTDAYKEHTYPNGWPKERLHWSWKTPLHSKQLQTHNLPTYDMENINSTNEPWVVPWGIERMPQRIQRHRRATLHWSVHPQQEQDQTDKSSYSLDWRQKSIWYGPAKLDNKLPQNVQNIRQSHKLYRENHENLESGLTAGWRSLAEVKIESGIFHGDVLSPLQFIIAMMPFNYILRKCTARYQFNKSQEKINHLMYMDNIVLFTKNEKELETLIQPVRIYSQDIGIEFGIEKCAMLIMKSRKWTKWNLQTKTKLERLEKRKPTNTWRYWKLTPSNKWRCKKKIRKEYLWRPESYSRENYVAETLSKE